MKKYMVLCIIANGLFLTSIVKTMDPLADIIARLQTARLIIRTNNENGTTRIHPPRIHCIPHPTNPVHANEIPRLIDSNGQIGTIPSLQHDYSLPENIYQLRPVIFSYAYDSSNAQPRKMCFVSTTRIPFVRAAAQEYNKNIPLIALSKELHSHVLVNKNNSIAQSINSMLALSITCTHFNNKLEGLGNILQCYDQETKNKTLSNLLNSVNDFTYWNKRRSVLLLVYARAEHNECCRNNPLLETAVLRNDLDMATVLFKYGANATLKNYAYPIFFQSKTPAMAQLFEDSGADLNTSGNCITPNVLWYVVWNHEPTVALTQFYLDKGIDPRTLNCAKQSILHCTFSVLISDNNPEQIKVIQLLLTKISDIINIMDGHGNTPLNLLIKEEIFPKKNIIALFKEYGAKTSQELKLIELAKKERIPTVVQHNKQPSCIICLGSFGQQDDHVNLPCKNNHPTDIHVECYNDLLKHSIACPLCRAELQ